MIINQMLGIAIQLKKQTNKKRDKKPLTAIWIMTVYSAADSICKVHL